KCWRARPPKRDGSMYVPMRVCMRSGTGSPSSPRRGLYEIVWPARLKLVPGTSPTKGAWCEKNDSRPTASGERPLARISSSAVLLDLRPLAPLLLVRIEPLRVQRARPDLDGGSELELPWQVNAGRPLELYRGRRRGVLARAPLDGRPKRGPEPPRLVVGPDEN